MTDRIEKQWKERYARCGLTKEQVKFYENAPMEERKAAAWREIDALIIADLQTRAQPSRRNISHEIIIDTMPQIMSHADGKHYDSKSQYYAALKAKDSHIIEKGEHDKPRSSEVKGDFNCRKELRDALQQHLPHMR